MDVAPILGVNHVKSACYVLHECDGICLLLLVIMHMVLVAVNVCMYYSAHNEKKDRYKLKSFSRLHKGSLVFA